jgi:hypothetical protein
MLNYQNLATKQYDQFEANSGQGPSNLAETIENLHLSVALAMDRTADSTQRALEATNRMLASHEELKQTLTRPKTVVRDEEGRIIGVK